MLSNYLQISILAKQYDHLQAFTILLSLASLHHNKQVMHKLDNIAADIHIGNMEVGNVVAVHIDDSDSFDELQIVADMDELLSFSLVELYLLNAW